MNDPIDASSLPASTHPTIRRVREDLIADGRKIEASLPGHMSHLAGDFIRLALVEFRRIPKLVECDPRSIVGAVLDCARLGLKPGPLGHVYFVPYRNECQLLIGYRGLIELALRSGEIESIEARVVYAGETFEVDYGTSPRIVHRPRFDVSHASKDVIAVYAIAHRRVGLPSFDVMSRAEVAAIEAKSKARGGPWSDPAFWSEMARKTITKRLAKYLPISTELAEAIAIDNDGTSSAPARPPEMPRRDPPPAVEAHSSLVDAALTWTAQTEDGEPSATG